MKPAVKWGIAAASGAAVFLALRKMKKAQEQNADNTQLALQQLVESSQSSEIVKSYGEVRVVRQEKTIDYWRLEAPPAVPGKELVSWYIETTGEQAFGIVPYRVNDSFGAIVMRNADDVPVSLRLKVIGIFL